MTPGWVASGLDAGGNRVFDVTLTREEADALERVFVLSGEFARSLEVGKPVDLVVLDRDFMTVPAADIQHIHPTLTMVGGRVVFSATK